jgi:hypothetical protein
MRGAGWAIGAAIPWVLALVGCEAVIGLADLSAQGGGTDGGPDSTRGDGSGSTRDASVPDAGTDGPLDSGAPGADAGTVLLHEDFESVGVPPCGLWNPDRATLALVSPGHNSAHACLVCGTPATTFYGVTSATPGLTARGAQLLAASAYVQSALPDGGAPDDGGTQSGSLDIRLLADDGGAFIGTNSQWTAFATSWQQFSYIAPVSQDGHSVGLEVYVNSPATGACFLVDDIDLLAE